MTSEGPAEIRTLAESFNAMTASLRHTMDELSRRSALAAVGEFAASLARGAQRTDVGENGYPARGGEAGGRVAEPRTGGPVALRGDAAQRHRDRRASGGAERTCPAAPPGCSSVPCWSRRSTSARPAFAAAGADVRLSVSHDGPFVVENGDPGCAGPALRESAATRSKAVSRRRSARDDGTTDDGRCSSRVRGRECPVISSHGRWSHSRRRPTGAGLGLPIARAISPKHTAGRYRSRARSEGEPLSMSRCRPVNARRTDAAGAGRSCAAALQHLDVTSDDSIPVDWSRR